MASSSSAEELSKRHRQQLDRYVDVPKLQDSTRLGSYYGMSKQVLAQASQFRESHDIDRAYIFYKRFLRLAVDCIPNHVAYRDSVYATDKNWLVRERSRAMEALEKVKVEIDAEMGKIQAHYQQKQKPQQPPPPPPPPPAPALDPKEQELEQRVRNLRGWDAPSSKKLHSPLGGGDGADFLHEEFQTSPLDVFPDGDSTFVIPEPSAPPLYLDDGPEIDTQGGSSTTMKEMPRPIDFENAFKSLRLEEGDGPNMTRYYPTVQSPLEIKKAKEERERQQREAAAAAAAAADAADWIKRRSMLRSVVLPSGLVGKFLEIAEPNTIKRPDGIETCGVLAGIQTGTEIRCTTLVIPKQEGTSDTVSMSHEEELFAYCCSGQHPQGEDGNLIQLGWIHTHPSQSCFMSSVDIHTHCAYQCMLPEAVAVVVALRDRRRPEVGVFRLTEPEGQQLIQRCELRGFHPHPLPDDQIYKNHHTVRWENSAFQVVDLR